MHPIFLDAMSCSRSPQTGSAGFWEPGLMHIRKFPGVSADSSLSSYTSRVPFLGSVLGSESQGGLQGYHSS